MGNLTERNSFVGKFKRQESLEPVWIRNPKLFLNFVEIEIPQYFILPVGT